MRYPIIDYLNEIPGSPKQVDEVKVTNETPQDTVLVSAEGSTTSPTKEASSDVAAETPLVVKETRIPEEGTLPTALEVPEEPKTSDNMETDAPQKESNAAQSSIWIF